MKRILNIYVPALLGLFLLTSCQNDDVPIVDTRTCLVNVEVSLDDFFSCYDFTDTKHSVENAVNSREPNSSKRFKSLNPAERYKSFATYSSDRPIRIETRVLFYNDRGLLVDSILAYSDDVNKVKQTVQLDAGKYTAIATLTFFRNLAGIDWKLKGKENLNTAVLQSNYAMSLWSIMAYASREFNVGQTKETDLQMTPTPVGALCCAYFEDFQSSDIIDGISIKTDNYAYGLRLSPKETNKYIYREETGQLFNSAARNFRTGATFWKTYQSDVFDYFYILAPQCNLLFSYSSGDEWEGCIVQSCAIENGKTYLAYWNYGHLDKPYFGLADNSHWY